MVLCHFMSVKYRYISLFIMILLCEESINIYSGTHGRMVKALDLISRGHGFDSRQGHVYIALGKLWNPHCLGPPSHNGYLAQQIQGWIVSCVLQDALTCRGERQSP